MVDGIKKKYNLTDEEAEEYYLKTLEFSKELYFGALSQALPNSIPLML